MSLYSLHKVPLLLEVVWDRLKARDLREFQFLAVWGKWKPTLCRNSLTLSLYRDKPMPGVLFIADTKQRFCNPCLFFFQILILFKCKINCKCVTACKVWFNYPECMLISQSVATVRPWCLQDIFVPLPSIVAVLKQVGTNMLTVNVVTHSKLYDFKEKTTILLQPLLY